MAAVLKQIRINKALVKLDDGLPVKLEVRVEALAEFFWVALPTGEAMAICFDLLDL